MVEYVTSAQIRAARALLNWSVRGLSEASGVHRNTISNIENGHSRGDAETIARLRDTFEGQGVTFIDQSGVAIG